MVRWWWRFLALGRYGGIDASRIDEAAARATFWEAVLFGWSAPPFGRKRVSFRLARTVENSFEWKGSTIPDGVRDWSGINAMLEMDGDRMGKVFSVTLDRAVRGSRALLQFAEGVPAIVRDHDGVLIYAGADDVKALLPIDTAIPCALRWSVGSHDCNANAATIAPVLTRARLPAYAGTMSLLANSRLPAALGMAVLAFALAGRPAWTQDAPPPKAEKRAPPAPGLPRTPAERERALSDLYAQLATAEDENGAKAIAERIERVWLHSGSPTVDLLFGRAMQAISAKNYDLALTFIDHVVEQAPDFTEAWSRRAYVHFQRNQVRLALGDLRRALALDPNHFKALDGLSQVLRDIGENRAALQVLRRLYDVHPYWAGAERAIEELSREVEGQGI